VALSNPVARPAAADREPVTNPYSTLPNWLYPAFVVLALSLFGGFAVWVVFFQHEGYYAPYLSPFYSPLIKVGPIPPGVWVAWAPLVFRLTCYYYRKAYFTGSPFTRLSSRLDSSGLMRSSPLTLEGGWASDSEVR